MRRYVLLISICVLATASNLFALQAVPKKGDRIGVLTMQPSRGVTKALPKYLVEELREEGFDAFLADTRGFQRDADFYIEFADPGSRASEFGGVGAIGRHGVGAEVSVVDAEVIADVRVYDREMELIEEFTLSEHVTTPALTGLGVGGRDGYLFLSVPFFRNAPYRLAARKVARETAERMTGRD